MTLRGMLRTKRIYEAPAKADGYRVLVDRIWPRGISKARAGLDQWLKDVAPSAQLRIWFGHEPAKWTTFVARYRVELRERPEALAALRELLRQHGTLTLLYAARDPQYNHAVALQRILMG